MTDSSSRQITQRTLFPKSVEAFGERTFDTERKFTFGDKARNCLEKISGKVA